MGELDTIVSVQITRETTVPSQAGFGTMLLLGQSSVLSANTVAEYSSLSEVADAFSSSDPEYVASSDFFGQELKPTKIKIAKAVPNGGAFVLKQSTAATLSVDINGQTVTGADLATLATNIAALDDVASAAVYETDYLLVIMNDGYAATVQNLTAGTGTISLIQGNLAGWDFGTAFDTLVALTVDGTEDTSATSYADLVDEIVGNAGLTVADGFAANNTVWLVADSATTPNVLTDGAVNSVAAGSVLDGTTKTMSDILDDLTDVDSDFYGVACITIDEVDVLSIASWVESNEKLFVTRSNSSAMLTTPDTTSISYQVEQLGYDRTIVCYHSKATTEYLDCAILGRQLPEDPGSVDWDLIGLSSITVDSLTSANISAIESTNANYFRTIAGNNYFRQGKVASGEWIDIIRGTDWLKARMQERIFTTIANAKKIPYTNLGIAQIEADIRAQLEEAITQGLLDGERGYSVTVPEASSVSAANKANRLLTDVSWSAYYAGAIHKSTITGTISL